MLLGVISCETNSRTSVLLNRESIFSEAAAHGEVSLRDLRAYAIGDPARYRYSCSDVEHINTVHRAVSDYSLRAAWSKWFDTEKAAMYHRWGQCVKDGLVIEDDTRVIETAEFTTVPWDEREATVGILLDAIQNRTLTSGSGLRLVHKDFSFNNIVIRNVPGNECIEAISGRDEAMILPIDVVPQFPLDMHDGYGPDVPGALHTRVVDNDNVISTMQDVFTAARSIHLEVPGPPNHEDAFMRSFQVRHLTAAFEGAFLREVCANALRSYNEELGSIPKEAKRARAIRALVDTGFVWWARNRRWIISHLSNKNSVYE